MKTIFYLVSTTTIILFVSCSNPKVKVVENPYEGAWEMTYSYWHSPDSTFESTNFKNPIVKLLTKKHFAVGYQAGENIIQGAGGEYSFKGDTFFTYRKYHYNSARAKDTIIWKSVIEGEVWTMSRIIKTDTVQRERIEKWKRIPE